MDKKSAKFPESISFEETADFLRKKDNYYILCHVSPDGDAVGSGYGLCRLLRNMGKKANVLCSDPIPEKYGYITDWYEHEKFTPKTIVTVDLADINLFGKELSVYSEYVELAIDHHISNTEYAKKTLVNPKASSACEVIYDMASSQGFQLDDVFAACIYTGIATDTGCFRFENTTKRAHIITAQLMEYNLPYGTINHELFEIKSAARIAVEQYAFSNIKTYLDDKCAMIIVSLDTIKKTGLEPEEFEGLAAIPMQLKGVKVGITVKEKEPGKFKVSMRSSADSDIDVSAICAKLGGGGHIRAAGCTVEGNPEQVKLKLLSAVAPEMGFDLWLS
ncbi:MAG: bifunctional oligoribonuclease/PAP phosphatase NrnA [Oscillospiraceae bacterium]|nr:bifunctional oligoribonuclease/PAP phosphatase NrnA [Oscillospiraceae bacterium]